MNMEYTHTHTHTNSNLEASKIQETERARWRQWERRRKKEKEKQARTNKGYWRDRCYPNCWQIPTGAMRLEPTDQDLSHLPLYWEAEVLEETTLCCTTNESAAVLPTGIESTLPVIELFETLQTLVVFKPFHMEDEDVGNLLHLHPFGCLQKDNQNETSSANSTISRKRTATTNKHYQHDNNP